LETGGLAGEATLREYTIVIEDAGTNLSAYVLDFDGCTTTGNTVEEVIENMREALETHIELMVDAGEPVPEPLDLIGTTKIAV
jgi:predicted RNase H-like HicB family nuclease